MRTIYAEYNINHDSIDVYTSAGLFFTLGDDAIRVIVQ
jgi:hypothetical protein